MNKVRSTLAISLISTSGFVFAEIETESLPTLRVEGSTTDYSYTTPSLEEAQQKLDSVPGGTALVPDTLIREGLTRSLADALEFTPGVYSRSRYGTDEVRLSIRGSGISQTFNARGVRLLRDGLPMTEADGNVRPQLLEPLNARYIEVYRGANALAYGAATLGGAINIVSPNARTTEAYPLRLEGGSHDYLRFQVANGRVLDAGWDVYGSLTGISQDGFRDNGKQETLRLYSNVGRRWNSDNETRVHIDIQDNNIELPGSLTKAELKSDPSQANAGSLNRNSQRDFNLYRVGVQHSLLLANGGQLDVGASYQNLSMYHPLSFALLESEQDDVSLSARVTQQADWAGRRNELAYGVLGVWGDSDNDQFNYVGGFGGSGNVKGTRREDGESEAAGVELFAQDSMALSRNIELIVGAQLVLARRESSITSFTGGVPAGAAVDQDETYTGFSPRLGVTWQATPNNQLFANVSRSYEPPTNGEFSQPLAGGTDILDAQTATTFEMGLRGRISERFRYELAVYYAKLKDEILTQEDPSLPRGSGLTVTSNADDTVHRGIELGAGGFLSDHISINAAYTLNDFKFDGDRLFGNNEIPGIPRHVLSAELSYHTDNGFYIGPTVEYASDWQVDFANSFKADSYTVWGARAGYQANRNLRFFVQAENLGDKKYASNTGIIADAGGADTAVFNPGVDRSIFAGVELKL